jgi:hypothetical protein
MWLEMASAASVCLVVLALVVSLAVLIAAVAAACVLSALLAYRVVRSYQQQLSYPRELIARELVAQTTAGYGTLAVADATAAGRIPPGTEVVGSGEKLRRPPMRGHPRVRAVQEEMARQLGLSGAELGSVLGEPGPAIPAEVAPPAADELDAEDTLD